MICFGRFRPAALLVITPPWGPTFLRRESRWSVVTSRSRLTPIHYSRGPLSATTRLFAADTSGPRLRLIVRCHRMRWRDAIDADGPDSANLGSSILSSRGRCHHLGYKRSRPPSSPCCDDECLPSRYGATCLCRRVSSRSRRSNGTWQKSDLAIWCSYIRYSIMST